MTVYHQSLVKFAAARCSDVINFISFDNPLNMFTDDMPINGSQLQ